MEDRRVSRTKNAVMQAFLELSAQNDTGKVTVTELAKKANIDRKTFYLHYDSVDAVFEEYVRSRIDELLPVLRANGFFDSPFDASVFFKSVFFVFEKDIQLYHRVAANPANAYLRDKLRIILKDEIRKKVFSDMLGLKAREYEYFSEFVSYGAIAVYLKWLAADTRDLTSDELANFVGGAMNGAFKALSGENK